MIIITDVGLKAGEADVTQVASELLELGFIVTCTDQQKMQLGVCLQQLPGGFDNELLSLVFAYQRTDMTDQYLVRVLVADRSAWEMVTFDEPSEVPIIFMPPIAAT